MSGPSLPLVSVIIVTYQHQPFIRTAIDSILAQQTDFPIEILISEDDSRDRTREIVLDYQRRYPDTIRLLLSDRNRNDNSVTTRAWTAARGKYIAALDGDDYWTDPRKLQKQVSILERHPDLFVCGHAVAVVNERGEPLKPTKFTVDADRRLSREDLAAEYPLPFLSLLFRNNGAVPPAHLFDSLVAADSFMVAFFGAFGGGYVCREVMGAHRVHAGGVWSSLDSRQATDHRNVMLRRLPAALPRGLRSVAYARLLAHAVGEDYGWMRRLIQIPYAAAMTCLWMTPRSAAYLLRRARRRWSRRAEAAA